VDRKDGINSVKVNEAWSLGESLYCIKGYKETDCDGKDIAFTYPWDSAQRGRSFLPLICFEREHSLTISGDGDYTFPVTVGAAGVVTIDRVRH